MKENEDYKQKNNYSSDISTLITIKADISKENTSSPASGSTPKFVLGYLLTISIKGEFTSGLKYGD